MNLLDVTLRIGGVFATERPAIIRTTLGSCIAVCLYDPVAQVGGMNHYMLPSQADSASEADPTRYGLQAMEVLWVAMQHAGARRDRVVAKVFGGGHVLNTGVSESSVPVRNIAFIEEYIREERIPVVAQDLGGFLPRRVHYYTQTGKVLVKRLGERALNEVTREEQMSVGQVRASVSADVTLFDD
jgi:chemotaxis protein CheD